MTNLIKKSESISSQEDFIQYLRANTINGRNLSNYGLAGLCGVHHTSILQTGGGFSSLKLYRKLSDAGFDCFGLQSNGFCAQAAWLTIEYFAWESKADAPGAKELARLFGSIGIKTCLELTSSEVVQQNALASMDYSKVLAHSSKYPGLQDELDYAVSQPSEDSSPVEYMPIRDMAELRGIKLDITHAQIVGRIMADVYKLKMKVDKAPKAQVKWKQDNGNWQSRKIGVYPIDMLVNFDSICAALNLC
jgi:hypothetical protein